MKPIAISLDPQTRYKLELLSRATEISRADLVAEAVRRYVDAEIEALAAAGKTPQEPSIPDNGPSSEEAGSAPPFVERWNIKV